MDETDVRGRCDGGGSDDGVPRGRRVHRWLSAHGERGSATAEYAVVILAAVAFAGVLVAVMRSGEVQSVLSGLVRGALQL